MSTQQQQEEPRMNCVDCDYSLCEGEFNSGKGRIMFNDVNDDGTKYRCGCCDDRVADPQGMFPDEEEELDITTRMGLKMIAKSIINERTKLREAKNRV